MEKEMKPRPDPDTSQSRVKDLDGLRIISGPGVRREEQSFCEVPNTQSFTRVEKAVCFGELLKTLCARDGTNRMTNRGGQKAQGLEPQHAGIARARRSERKRTERPMTGFLWVGNDAQFRLASTAYLRICGTVAQRNWAILPQPVNLQILETNDLVPTHQRGKKEEEIKKGLGLIYAPTSGALSCRICRVTGAPADVGKMLANNGRNSRLSLPGLRLPLVADSTLPNPRRIQPRRVVVILGQ